MLYPAALGEPENSLSTSTIIIIIVVCIVLFAVLPRLLSGRNTLKKIGQAGEKEVDRFANNALIIPVRVEDCIFKEDVISIYEEGIELDTASFTQFNMAGITTNEDGIMIKTLVLFHHIINGEQQTFTSHELYLEREKAISLVEQGRVELLIDKANPKEYIFRVRIEN